MTKLDNLTNSFSSKLNISNDRSLTKNKKTPQNQTHIDDLDFDTVIQNDSGRKLFSMYLKEFNNSCDSLLTLYLICRCFQNHQRIEDRQRFKQILEKTYNACFIKNELTHLSSDLKQKIGESLQRKTYNESVFNAVRSELKLLLETHYFPQFLESNFYKDNEKLFSSLVIKHDEAPTKKNEKLHDKHSTSLISLDNEHNTLRKASNKVSSSFFAMPNIPKSKNIETTRMLKQSKSSSSSTSSVASVSSISKASSSSKFSKSTNNNSKSVSKSSLSNLESSYNKLTRQSHYKSNTSINSLNLPPNPYHVATKAIPVSAQDSERQSCISADDINLKNSRLPKLNKQIKQNLMANKGAKVNMPEFKAENATQPMKKASDNKAQLPLAESNPQEFFNILSDKINAYINGKIHSKQQSNRSKSNQSHVEMSEMSFRDNFEQLAVPYESDIDAQLDEHLNRVYNTNDANLNNSKMSFVKVSSLSRTKQDRSLNISNISNVLAHQQQAESNPLNSTLKHHHFYKLTSTSKEVAIDDTHHNTNNKKINEISRHKEKTNLSKHKETRKSSNHINHQNPLDNYDSGVSIRSAASIERVNDWLNQTSHSGSNDNEIKKLKKNLLATPDKKSNQEIPSVPPAPIKKVESDIKTTVAYYLPGEDLAYISTFNGGHLTLAQFKHLITKKGQFRYFFKTISDLLDEECIVYQEATDENSMVPMFKNKVIAKIEKCSS